MTQYVAFLRGINVGGHVVKMDRLRKVFEGIGLENVRTFIASGNVLFESPPNDPQALERKISGELRKALGYEVATFIRSADEVRDIAEHEPFDAAALKEGSLLVGMLPDAMQAREKKLVRSLETTVDSLRMHKREVYWPARQNFAKAEFPPARMEKLIGKPATFRNINTIRRIAALFVKPCLVLALIVPQEQKPLLPLTVSIVTYRAALLRNWSDAVLKHEPGIDDKALTIARQWSKADLQDAWLLVNILITVFEHPQANRFMVSIAGRLVPVDISAQDRRAIQDRAEILARLPGRNRFLKRAAVYHTDLALLGDRDARRTAIQPSFLVPSRMVLETTDGRHDGTYDGDVNWEFARVLLDGVTEVRKDDAVAQWYRATLSHKLAIELLDSHHFRHGLRVFPDDPEILFLNGSLHDASADPRVQTVRDELRLPADTFLDIKPEEDELRLAESLFRRTLERQSDHVEARLRHGRVLDRLGRTSDAVVALRLTLEQAKEPLLQYYALIFLGAVEQKLDRLQESQLAFERAAALFPDAPAPRLGLSQLAYRAGDRVRARELLEPALASDGKKQTDPWWTYRVTPGRRTAESMEAMYRALTGAS